MRRRCRRAAVGRSAVSHPVQGLRVYVWSGTDGALGNRGVDRLVQTLERNGMPVKGYVLLAQPLANVAALDQAWTAEPPPPGTTHALVLTRQRLDGFGAANYIRYEAVLWDAESRSLVWQAALASAANIRGIDAARRDDRLAGDILRGLSRDGLVDLRGQVPRDDSGAEIPATLIPLQIR